MLTTRQAAQLLGLSREQLLRRVERGEILGRYEGGRWLIDPGSLKEYADRLAASQGPAAGEGDDETGGLQHRGRG